MSRLPVGRVYVNDISEVEWLSQTNPQPLLLYLAVHFSDPPGRLKRKLILWLEACLAGSPVPDDMDHWSGTSVWDTCLGYVQTEWPDCPKDYGLPDRAALLREVFGNPWRPVESPVLRGAIGDGEGGVATVEGWYGNWQSVFAWDGGTIPRMAQAIHDGRRFGDMPVLADALEEAGCEDRQILDHCRGYSQCLICAGKGEWQAIYSGRWPPPPVRCGACRGTGRVPLGCGHVRGCWVLDLLLGQD